LVAVNNEDVRSKTVEEITRLIKGTPNSPVKLTLLPALSGMGGMLEGIQRGFPHRYEAVSDGYLTNPYGAFPTPSYGGYVADPYTPAVEYGEACQQLVKHVSYGGS